jgi:CRP-like cAMP-binding protein
MLETPAASAQKNRILAALPQAELDRLFSSLEPVSLAQRQVLHEVGAPFEHLYFIEAGVASVLTSMADGSRIEVGMIGREGIVGAAALLGGERSAQHVIVQVCGAALRMKVAKCRAAFDGSAAVRVPVLRYIQAFLDLSAQTAACNRLHSIEQRCARWLLMARDRVDGDEMPMTHEFLATMLGVRRAGVTETVGELHRSGLIQNHRGAVTILDREGLEAAACECYRLDHERLLRLLSNTGPPPGATLNN